MQVQLQAELAPYGIDTRVVDRYIVSGMATLQLLACRTSCACI
jgi:hypothetical protein